MKRIKSAGPEWGAKSRIPGREKLSMRSGTEKSLERPEEALEVLTRTCREGRDLDAWEVYLEQERRLAIEAKEGEVESLISARVMGAAVRVITSGRVGFSFTNDFFPSAIKDAVDRARETARHVSDKRSPGFVAPRHGDWPALDIMDPRLDEIGQDEKVSRAMTVESSALSCDPRVARVRGAEYEEFTSRIWIRNSEGLDASAAATLVSASVEVVAEDGGEAQAAGEFETTHHYDKLDAASVGEKAARRAVALLGACSLPAGRYPVVLSPEAGAGLISVLAPAACGDAVVKQRSWLIGRQGNKIAGPAVTIVDDGLMDSGPGATPFDDEGTISRRVEVVREGVLQSFLYDTYYGKITGAGSTGNGIRPAYFAPPYVDTTNWVLVPGKYSERELLGQVDDGLFIVELMGLHTADSVAGEFSLGALGFRIEKGVVGEPVAGITVAGTLEETLEKVEAISDTVKFSGDTGSPAILISEMDISGSERGRDGYAG
jgi:PmbA protein